MKSYFSLLQLQCCLSIFSFKELSSENFIVHDQKRETSGGDCEKLGKFYNPTKVRWSWKTNEHKDVVGLKNSKFVSFELRRFGDYFYSDLFMIDLLVV